MKRELLGERRSTFDDVWNGEPGDYFPVITGDGKVVRLWFKLPTGSLGSIAANGHGIGDEPTWKITEESDGTITVDPLIKQEPNKDPVIEAWHGHLEYGIWKW